MPIWRQKASIRFQDFPICPRGFGSQLTAAFCSRYIAYSNFRLPKTFSGASKRLAKLGKPKLSLKGLALLLKPYFAPKVWSFPADFSASQDRSFDVDIL